MSHLDLSITSDREMCHPLGKSHDGESVEYLRCQLEHL